MSEGFKTDLPARYAGLGMLMAAHYEIPCGKDYTDADAMLCISLHGENLRVRMVDPQSKKQLYYTEVAFCSGLSASAAGGILTAAFEAAGLEPPSSVIAQFYELEGRGKA